MIRLPVKLSGFLSQPINMIVDWCQRNTLVDSRDIARIEMAGGGVQLKIVRPDMDQHTFPWGADHPWGLVSVEKAVVTIAPGTFQAGNGAALATVQTAMTITADAQYIGLQYDPSAGALSLVGPTTDMPVPGNGVWQQWLYFCSFDPTSGFATSQKHNLTGGWHAALYAFTTA